MSEGRRRPADRLPTRSLPGNAPTAKRLYAAAAKLFRAKGFAATTTRELAAVVGVQKASLYYHAPRKDDLLYDLCIAALDQIEGAVQNAIEEAASPIDKLRGLVFAHLTTVFADCDLHATQLTELRSLPDAMRAQVVSRRDAYESLVRRIIRESQLDGSLRSDIDSKYMGLALLNLMNWTMFWYRPGGDLPDQALIAILWGIFCGGAFRR